MEKNTSKRVQKLFYFPFIKFKIYKKKTYLPTYFDNPNTWNKKNVYMQ